MIDAYEIGIQLALQDGVSAGMRVIAQELGALDRAVAATAGRLEALTTTAQGAARAVAAAGAVRLPTVVEPAAAAPEPVAAGPSAVARAASAPGPGITVAARQADAERAAPVVRTIAMPERAAPERAAAAAGPSAPVGPAAPAATPMAAAPVAVPMASAPVGPAAAPARAAAPITQAAPAVQQAAADPMPVAPVAAARAPQASPPAPAAPVARDAPQAAAPRVMMAAPAMAPAAAALPVAPAAPSMPGVPIRSMEREFRRAPDAPAPWVPAMAAAPQTPAAPVAMGPGGQAAEPARGLLAGRPAAPPPEARDGGKNGGDVMLDGHLVGHWLADRMGRDAARPSAGTTQFDSRQAPAWMPGGTL